ncbi:bifunctional phosphopantothenoylcysteine decarboxylase/phosphopantothenate--cysteine ligase CoaBC [Bacillaceae bacterium S4-13-56]
MLTGKKIILGVSGGIAVYKACTLTSRLVQRGAQVKVVMTESAQEFVTPLTFQALSRQPVFVDTFDEKDPSKIAHIDIADWADLVLLAPATANVIGKLANGIADDMLSTVMLATQAPVYIAPAMNVHMYDHPAVKKNMKTLEEYGYSFIEPGEGYLACGYVGKGRLEEPETIIDVLEQQLRSEATLKGKKVLITAGPTQESLDPVRYFTNHSSGKMGYALAEEAYKAGANVTLITGPTSLQCPNNVKCISVITAQDMLKQVLEHYDSSDIVIKSAAVADYRPKIIEDEKIKKKSDYLSIELERTTDILATLGQKKKDQYLVGFAAETQKAVEYGRDKLDRKNLDAIAINNVKDEGAGFGKDTNVITFITKSGKQIEMEKASKNVIAKKMIELIVQDFEEVRF